MTATCESNGHLFGHEGRCIFCKAAPSPNAPQAEAVVTEGDREAAIPFIARRLLLPVTRVAEDPSFVDKQPETIALARHRLAALRQHQSEVEALRGELKLRASRAVGPSATLDALAPAGIPGEGSMPLSEVEELKLALEEADRKNEAQLHEWNNAEARATKLEAENERLCKFIDAVQEEYWLRAGNADLDDLMNDLRQARDAQG